MGHLAIAVKKWSREAEIFNSCPGLSDPGDTPTPRGPARGQERWWENRRNRNNVCGVAVPAPTPSFSRLCGELGEASALGEVSAWWAVTLSALSAAPLSLFSSELGIKQLRNDRYCLHRRKMREWLGMNLREHARGPEAEGCETSPGEMKGGVENQGGVLRPWSPGPNIAGVNRAPASYVTASSQLSSHRLLVEVDGPVLRFQ